MTDSLFGFSAEKTGEAKEVKSEAFIETMGMIVRKSAHFLIFFVLGFCATNAFRYIFPDDKRLFLISLGWCVLYAVSDELHQYFVPGRSCMWQDCAIDAAGALAGIGTVFLIFRIIKKHKGGKNI